MATKNAVATDPILTRDADHIYRLHYPDGREKVLPGVNEVERGVGLETDDYYTEEHSSRGTAVHAELASIARGLPPFEFLDPDLCGWRQSGVDFLASLRAQDHEVVAVEAMRYHPLYEFAGQIDLLTRRAQVLYLWDWKTGKAVRSTRFKMAAYGLLVSQAGAPIKKAAVELNRDGGRARVVAYNDVDFFHDGDRFLAHLTTLRDLRAFGPKK